MSDFLDYYCLFAASVGVTSYFSIYKPALKTLEDKDIPVVNHPIITAVVLMLVSAIVAPFIFISTIKGIDDDMMEKVLKHFNPTK